jgi:N utilization substance protein B
MKAGEIDARRAARLAAVQALYQMEIAGASTAQVIDDFDTGKLPRETEASITETEGDMALFKTLIESAVDRQLTLDRTIARHLGKGWKLERLDAADCLRQRCATVLLRGPFEQRHQLRSLQRSM